MRGGGRWGAAHGFFGGVSRVGALPMPTGGRGGNPIRGEGPCPDAGPSAVGCTWDFLWVALSGSFRRNPELGCLPCSSRAPRRAPAIRALRPSFPSVTHNRDMQLHGCFLGKYPERVPGQKQARCPGLSQGRPGSLQQGQGLPQALRFHRGPSACSGPTAKRSFLMSWGQGSQRSAHKAGCP